MNISGSILVDLVETEPLLLGVLVGRRIILNDTLRTLAEVRARRMALESKVIRLHLGGQSRKLAQEIVRNLGVPGGLIRVRADEDEPHLWVVDDSLL